MQALCHGLRKEGMPAPVERPEKARFTKLLRNGGIKTADAGRSVIRKLEPWTGTRVNI